MHTRVLGKAPTPREMTGKDKSEFDQKIFSPTNCCKVRQLLNGAVTSLSTDNANSFRLLDMVNEFLEEEAASKQKHTCGRARCNCDHSKCCTEGEDAEESYFSSALDSNTALRKKAKEIDCIVRCKKAEDDVLMEHVIKAVDNAKKKGEEICQIYGSQKLHLAEAFLRRYVLKYLRSIGYNAGLCRSKRENVSGMPPDEHEYLDIIIQNGCHTERLFVDVKFRAQFKIARPTSFYKHTLRKLPKIFIGNALTLKRIIALMCDAAKISLEHQGMPVPPWRRQPYMQAKWLSNYTRITEDLEFFSTVAKTLHLKDGKLSGGYGSKYRKGTRQVENDSQEAELRSAKTEWQPPPTRPRSLDRMEKMAGALAMALMEAGNHVHAVKQQTTPHFTGNRPTQSQQHLGTMLIV